MIQEHLWHGLPVYTMRNENLAVSLCPSLGNNLYRVWDEAKQREVLRVPDSPEALKKAPGHYGTPVMLPPNRIRHGVFHYNGKEYRLEVNTPNGHHIHGFLRHHPWQVTSFEENGDTAKITSVFSTADFPDIMRQYPHDLRIEMTYELKGASLNQTVTIQNRSESAAPVGFGLHTWFLLDGEPERWTLRLPVSNVWELDGDNIPTGRLLPLGRYEPIASGMNLRGQDMDTVFQVSGRPNVAVLAKDGYEIRYSTSDPYKQWVIYTQGVANELICLEPYTWVTNAPNLNLDPEITGLRAIEPGGALKLEVGLQIIHS